MQLWPPRSCCLFLTAEKLSKLADGDRAATEELLVLLEEGVWDSIEQQGFSRFVSCNPSLFSKPGCANLCWTALPSNSLLHFHQLPTPNPWPYSASIGQTESSYPWDSLSSDKREICSAL